MKFDNKFFKAPGIRNPNIYVQTDPVADSTDYLCFIADEDNSEITLNKSVISELLNAKIEYSTNKGIWVEYEWEGLNGFTIFLNNKNDKVWFRAKDKNESFSVDWDIYYYFSITRGSVSASRKHNEPT